MTLLFAESFDWLTTSSVAPVSSKILYRWDINTEVGNNSVIDSAQGRFGTSGLIHGNASNVLTKILDANYTTLFYGIAIKPTSTPSSALNLFAFWDGTTAQITIRMDTNRKLAAYRGATLLGTATMAALPVGAYRYIEVKVKFHGSTGTIDIRVDGSSVLSLTAQNTIVTANAYANRISIGDPSTGGGTFTACYYDDLYVCDDVDQSIAQPGSPVNNTFLGDIRVQCLTPDGNGASSQWLGSDSNSTDNYLLVDETPINDDTDYVADSTSGERDSYTFGNLTPTSGTVFGVQISAIARKDDAGARSIYLSARSGGTYEDSAAAVALASSYTGVREVRGAKPGAAAWSISDVNSAEFGVKVS